jgi:hypothetical protein
MPIPQTRLGLYGGPATALPGAAAAPVPILAVAFAMQCDGIPQQFPAAPQERHLSSENTGFGLSVQMLDGNGNPIDVSGAEELELLVKWPGGQVQVVPASFVSNGTDGQIGAALPGGLGGGWGLYWISARAVFPNQVLRTQAGRLWYGWSTQ